MARGRMLNASISESRKYHTLSSDTARLAATWALAHLDYNGVMPADPALFKAKVLPWRDDLSLADIESIVSEMSASGLVYLWEEQGRLWLWFPGFVHNQVGLRQWRERQSDYPAPPQEAEDLDWIPNGAATDGLRMPNGKPPEPPKKPKRRSVEQDRPEAVEIFRSVHRRYPKKATWDEIGTAVGDDEEDLEFWKQVCSKWKMLGWNPDNLDGQLEHYNKRALPGSDRKTAGKTGKAPGVSALEELGKEEGWF